MKKCNLFIAAILVSIAGVSLMSCSGSSDDNDNEPSVNQPRVSVQLVADKSVIEADGEDLVTFSVIDNNGVDVTKDSYIKNITTGTSWKKGVNTFVNIENGIVKFAATAYDDNGKYQTDTITITSQNRKKYELFKKRIAVFKITGTWCTNCPTMTAMIKAFEKTNPNTILEMSFHASTTDSSDPFHTDAASYLANAMGMAGFPSSVFDLYSGTLLANPGSALFKETISKQLAKEPAICGIKVKATTDGDSIFIDASLKTDRTAQFELAYVLLQDGLVANQIGGTADYVHNNTVVSITGNFLGSTDKVTVESGKTHDFPRITMGKGYPTATATRVLVYAIINKDGKNTVNNIVECKIGEEVDYEENAD